MGSRENRYFGFGNRLLCERLSFRRVERKGQCALSCPCVQFGARSSRIAGRGNNGATGGGFGGARMRPAKKARLVRGLSGDRQPSGKPYAGSCLNCGTTMSFRGSKHGCSPMSADVPAGYCTGSEQLNFQLSCA